MTRVVDLESLVHNLDTMKNEMEELIEDLRERVAVLEVRCEQVESEAAMWRRRYFRRIRYHQQ